MLSSKDRPKRESLPLKTVGFIAKVESGGNKDQYFRSTVDFD